MNPDIARIVREAVLQAKNDVASTTPTTNLMRGPQGIFGVAGISDDVFSAMVHPYGLNSVLPAIPSENIEDYLVPYLTGITDEEDASEPTGPCDDPLQAGDIKSAYQGAFWGKVRRRTGTLDIGEIGKRSSAAETMLLSGVGVGFESDASSRPVGSTAMLADILKSEVRARMVTVGVAFERKLGAMNWTGSPANNTSGGYAEFQGLETLVGTGKTDALTGVAVPALDSDVRTFSYQVINGTTALTLFEILKDMYRHASYNAQRMGFNPVQFVFVMRRGLFDEIADYWPLVYASYRGQSSQSTMSNNTDALALRGMADAMRTGQYLLIDGVQVPVVTDDYMPEASGTTNANVASGNFASDIYLLPLTVAGGRPVLFHQFFNFSGPGAAASALAEAGVTLPVSVSNDGRFLWTASHTDTCLTWTGLVKPMLRLQTPHIAGRLQNVVYGPVKHYREALPDDPYFVNGGGTTRTNSLYVYS